MASFKGIINYVKNNKAEVAAWILIPTAAVGAFYGVKYIKKKYDDKKALALAKARGVGDNTPVDTTGMEYYTVTMPFDTKKFGNVFDSLSKFKNYYIGEKVIKNTDGSLMGVLEFMALPSDEALLKAAISDANSLAKVVLTTKDKLLTPEKPPVCTKDNLDIDSFDDFHEAVKCLKEWKVFGYDLTLLKEKTDLASLVTLDDLRDIFELASIGTKKITKAESNQLLDLMHKIYP